MTQPVRDFHEYVLQDVLGRIPGITSRNMFGGFGFYLDGVIFAFITDESELRFKVDGSICAQYESYGSKPFVYDGYKKKKAITMDYYTVPEEVMEDPETLTDWVYRSAEISKRSKKQITVIYLE